MDTNMAEARNFMDTNMAEARNFLIWAGFWIAALILLLPALAGN